MEDMAPARSVVVVWDEATLLAKMQAGDDDAFEACVRTYCTRLLIVARRMLGNEEDAREVLQDAFLSAFKQIAHFESRSGLGTWLHRIVVNAALGRLRTRKRHPEKSIEDLLPHFGEDEHQIDPPAPWKETVDSALQQQESRQLVRNCMDRLPEIYRNILLLRDIEGVDTEEAARILCVSQGVVKTRLHRARQALRTLLDPHWRKGDV